MIPVTIVDNFFEDPISIRSFALQQEFKKTPGNYPGFRTEFIEDLNKDLFDNINTKLFSLFFDLTKERLEWRVQSFFQLVPKRFEEGWVHQDLPGSQIAGVVYLTPYAPVNCGTSIYSKIKNHNPRLDIRNKFYADEETDLDNYRVIREEHNSNYIKTVDVGNVFNRLFVYNANQFHKENGFFGKTKNDSRLTYVFFANLIANETLRLPVERSKAVSLKI